MKSSPQKGFVSLVGAGPGDPGLLTEKGSRRIEQAQVIFYDRLSAPVLEGRNLKARLVYVGKRGRAPTVSQEKIHEMLIAAARKGLRVVRLKGGDPFIFGRGGEEAMALREAALPFEIIPGVSSAIAAPAYAGIPLTHRDFTSEVVFLTAHTSAPKTERHAFGQPVNWEAVSKLGTIVILMGREGLAQHVESLIQHGKNPDTPAALISWGTTARQKSILTSLKNLPVMADKAQLPSPAIAVVGEVASLHEKLDWFESNNLFGKTIFVTQALEKQGRLAALFREKGALVTECPVISIRPPRSFGALDGALQKMSRYDLVIFTSRTTVEKVWDRIGRIKKDSRIFADVLIAAIGPSTAEALEGRGVVPDLVPTRFHSEGLIAAFKKKRIKLKGKRVLLPRAPQGREELVAGLKKLGAKVDEVEAYRVVGGRGVRRDARATTGRPYEDHPDWIVFTSGEAVRHFVAAYGLPQNPHTQIACIGPITQKAAARAGFQNLHTPRKATLEALVEMVEKLTTFDSPKR